MLYDAALFYQNNLNTTNFLPFFRGKFSNVMTCGFCYLTEKVLLIHSFPEGFHLLIDTSTEGFNPVYKNERNPISHFPNDLSFI